MISCEERTPFYSQEEEEWGGWGENFQKENTLPSSWDIHMDSELVWSFQPSLEMRARLTSFIFLKPKPLESFGVQRES